MSEQLHIGTRKGLFEIARRNGVWEIVDAHFLGDPVSAVLAEADGTVYAALDRLRQFKSMCCGGCDCAGFRGRLRRRL